MRILVSGMMVGVPAQGGATWSVLQYVLGLRRLGHAVTFVEPVDAVALRPEGADVVHSVQAACFHQLVRQFNLDSAALLVKNTRETIGLDYASLEQAAAKCDILFNISGMLTDQALTSRISCRAYLDLDPGFNQMWHRQGIDMHFQGHTHFVTVGTAVGQPDCRVPTCGRTWITTLQPIVLEHWPVAKSIQYDAFTTIANWRGYGSITHEGVFYGQKAHSLRSLIELPKRTGRAFLVALAIHPDEVNDVKSLKRNGWRLLNPVEVAGTPDRYQEFIQGSKAELGIAKSGYVTSRSGWFSDRSICYLASGRPVLAQETGFSDALPTGDGLFSFTGYEEIQAALEELDCRYEQHARAARTLAETYFDSDRVLGRLLEQVRA